MKYATYIALIATMSSVKGSKVSQVPVDGPKPPAKCPFGYDQVTDLAQTSVKTKSSEYDTPSDIFVCEDGSAGVTTSLGAANKSKYRAIVADVIAAYDAVASTVGDEYNPRAKFAGCLVRTAGHDFMDFRTNTDGSIEGGSDGCIHFADGDNAGLADCLIASTLPEIYKASTYCNKVSVADFLVVAAEAVMGRTAADYDASITLGSGDGTTALE